jgi:hypothetical protein
MPVEIKEMVIKALIHEKGTALPDGLSEILESQTTNNPKLTYTEKEEIIEACIERVMKEIERQMRSL